MRKFPPDPSSGSRVVPCGQTEGRTDMTKLTVAFRNFARLINTDEGYVALGVSVSTYANTAVQGE